MSLVAGGGVVVASRCGCLGWGIVFFFGGVGEILTIRPSKTPVRVQRTVQWTPVTPRGWRLSGDGMTAPSAPRGEVMETW